jgi:hypothetical protein
MRKAAQKYLNKRGQRLKKEPSLPKPKFKVVKLGLKMRRWSQEPTLFEVSKQSKLSRNIRSRSILVRSRPRPSTQIAHKTIS